MSTTDVRNDEFPSEKLETRPSHHLHREITLDNNIQAKVQNPLHGIPHDELVTVAQEFCVEHGMQDKTDFVVKGALIAQNPGAFESIAELDAADREVIHRERTHKWHQPAALYFTIILCSVGAAVQGWDQEGSNGANLSFPIALGINDNDPDPAVAATNQWLVGLINAGPYIGASLCGCWLSDPLNNLFGRRGTIFICAIFCILPVIGSACAQTWYQLFICRLLLGLGMGAKASTVPVFAAENTPASIRGGLVMSWQMWTAFGIFLGVCANLILYQVGDIAWRLQFGSAFLPAVPLLIGIFFCPESPRWYLKKGRYHDAYRSLCRLRNTELQAARDLFYIHSQLEAERELLHGSTYFSRAIELFTIPRIRRATLASFVVMLAQQMCGINIIAFYSSTVFVEGGYSEKSALLASFGFGLVNWVFAFPAVWTIDTFGRRNLLLSTFPNMAWSLLASGLCYLIPNGNPAKIPLVALFIFIFAAFYSPGEGPVPFTYSAEVFPLSHREMGMAWAVATCLFWAAVLSLTFPRMIGAMTITGAFCFYAGLNMVAFVMIFFLVPETKERTLEELDYIFAVPVSTHAHYQLRKSLPYFINRYILWRRSATLDPLYDFEEVDEKTVHNIKV
ncbi:sugar transporter [Calocera viscosa TUFC12733]|uniref:Sugar transporter n=1 Tax=Calocera viscosa (strain TUFC12733) TaxID=1330018 RepID=A0A167RT09_CALVF|nr:sugar transporter [Calocera viscosa TUFC12733]